MTVTTRAWAHGFDRLTGPIILQKGGVFYAQLQRPQGVERAILVSGFLMDSIEVAVGTSGLQALLNSASSGARMNPGGSFAADIAAAVRNARAV